MPFIDHGVIALWIRKQPSLAGKIRVISQRPIRGVIIRRQKNFRAGNKRPLATVGNTYFFIVVVGRVAKISVPVVIRRKRAADANLTLVADAVCQPGLLLGLAQG